jgi:probable phosphoglycerate mutase
MFSHAGASGAALSHILNIPFPQFCAGFHINFVSSFVVNLADKPGALVYPQIKFIDDVLYREEKHSQNFYGN